MCAFPSNAVVVLVITLAGALAGPSVAQEHGPTPIRWSAQPLSRTSTAGGVITVQAVAMIDEGWHLYALDPVEGGPIPTRITAGPAVAFTLQEKDIEKEEPKRALDPNFGVETAYYEEGATFGLPITVGTNVKAGEREIEVTVRFQACTAKICLRPQTATMKLEIKILE